MDQVRTYVIKHPLEKLPVGSRTRQKPSGLRVTVEVAEDGTQTWTYDYRGSRF
jgi:hypothetical protein